MACDQQGRIEGSLSGGCVEEDLVARLTSGTLASIRSEFFRYGETAEEATKFGLPCGGLLYILVEPLAPSPAQRKVFRRIRERLDSRLSVKRVVDLNSGESRSFGVSAFAELELNSDQTLLSQVYGPRFQLLIIGAGLVSRYVAEFAMALDYEVTVCDPRADILEAFPLSGVLRVSDMPDDAVRRYARDRRSAIVALTHDPRIDDMGMMEALETEAFYVGAMGSSRTSSKRRERLLDLGVTEGALHRLHAPIGIPIGSKTPPEIAISVLAEITAERRSLESREKAEPSPHPFPAAAEAT